MGLLAPEGFYQIGCVIKIYPNHPGSHNYAGAWRRPPPLLSLPSNGQSAEYVSDVRGGVGAQEEGGLASRGGEQPSGKSQAADSPGLWTRDCPLLYTHPHSRPL